MPHISIAAETVINVLGFPVSNSLIATVIVSVLLIVFALSISGNLKKRPGKAQLIAELIIGGLHSFFGQMGGRHGEKFFPLVTTIFLFVVASNWFGLLPGVGSIGVYHTEEPEHEEAVVEETTQSAGEATPAAGIVTDDHAPTPTISQHGEEEVTAPATTESVDEEEHEEAAGEEGHRALVPILRGPTADLNNTIALGIVAFFAIQYFGFSVLGLGHMKRYIDISNPIKFFVGILEAVLDFSKIISFAFRLFGNIFAGEVLLGVMAFLMPVLVPVPFFMIEVFVGLIQGLVFAMLTSVFISLAVSHGHSEEHAHVEATH